MVEKNQYQITPDELKQRLNSGSVFILDVRNQEEFSRWHIEGKNRPEILNVPYFEFLENEEESAKKVPKDKPIIVVCAKGESANWVTNILRPRGYEALSLKGGMLGWGSFYDIHELPESLGDVVRIYQLERTARGCLHYIVAYGDRAVVIDPPRHIEQVLEFTGKMNLRITHIFDTHAHADHISGGVTLSKKTGVPYYLHPYDGIHPIDVLPARIYYEPLWDGMKFKLGEATLNVIHIPGHTLGNLAYLIEGKQRYLFSGDSIFINSISRPDLGGRADTWAPLHYRSLFEKLLKLPDDINVLPGHFSTFSEAREDGVFIATLGELKRKNPDLFPRSEKEFVDYILSSLPVFPPQYLDIKRVNAGLIEVEEEKENEFELGKNVCALARAYQS